jgi:hypothetical protein
MTDLQELGENLSELSALMKRREAALTTLGVSADRREASDQDAPVALRHAATGALLIDSAVKAIQVQAEDLARALPGLLLELRGSAENLEGWVASRQ